MGEVNFSSFETIIDLIMKIIQFSFGYKTTLYWSFRLKFYIANKGGNIMSKQSIRN